jgi:ABC-2 type transport system ATP-binding protein
VANNNLSFDVYNGEIFGFLGANGAGKTTAMRILCGLSSPSSGEINVAGFDVYRERKRSSEILAICLRNSLYMMI